MLILTFLVSLAQSTLTIGFMMVFKFYNLQINSRPLKCHLVFVAHNVLNLVTSSGNHIKLDLVYEVLFPSKVSKISQKCLPAAAVIGALMVKDFD